MTPRPGSVLLTGATGFVGMELLARYLERSDRDVVTLIRAADDGAARERMEGVLKNLFGRSAAAYARRVHAVASELTAPGLGLELGVRERLAERISTIVHSAASVSFVLPLDEARAINVEGTRSMLEFASIAQERGGLDRYGHVSTAYVSGLHEGRFSERDLEMSQGFRNTYEQTKFEAEQLVRAAEGLPYTIMRPSIVVGDRRSGWTAAFNVLYWPLRAFSRGLFTSIPAIPSAPVDVVSIDYVADGIHELCERPGGERQTYHLTAGSQASTLGEIAELASGYFNRPMPVVVPPDDFVRTASQAQLAGLEESSVYFPYFSIKAEFDDAATRARLEPAGIKASPLCDYMERLLDFATASRWGKQPIARVEALAA
jgi:thioester reductase-like protein